MRPKSIAQFEWVYLLSLLIGIVSSYLLADQTSATLRNSGMDIGPGLLITTQWVISAVMLAIALLASRRASSVARWIILVLTGIGVLAFPFSLPGLPAMGSVAILGVAQFVLAVVTIYLLLRPDARAWFMDGRDAA